MWLGDKLQKLNQVLRLPEEKKGRILADMLRTIDAQSSLKSAERRTIPGTGPMAYIFKKMPVAAAFVLILLLGGGTSFAAQGSLPGDILYPVKIGLTEKIAETFQFTPQAKATFESQVAATRLDEAAKLASQNRLSDNWKNVLGASFEAHATAAQKTITNIQAQGDAATAAGLASDLEASLKARHAVINQLEGSSTVTIGQTIADTVKIRQEAESGITSVASQDPQGAKNSADGKLNAAENVISSAENYVGNLNLNTSTLFGAQEKLSEAQNLYSQAQTKLNAGDYSGAFNQAQEAIRTAQEVKISTNLQSDLNLKGPFSVTVSGEDDGKETENEGSGRSIPAAASSTQFGNFIKAGEDDARERTSGNDTLAPRANSTSTPFKVNVRGDDGGGD